MCGGDKAVFAAEFGELGNFGVDIFGASTVVTSVDGAISITGQGGNGSRTNNVGVFLDRSGGVESTGTGVHAATITINGTAGGVGGGRGVALSGSPTRVASVDGAISITGPGGNGANGSNVGISSSNAVVVSTGNFWHRLL